MRAAKMLIDGTGRDDNHRPLRAAVQAQVEPEASLLDLSSEEMFRDISTAEAVMLIENAAPSDNASTAPVAPAVAQPEAAGAPSVLAVPLQQQQPQQPQEPQQPQQQLGETLRASRKRRLQELHEDFHGGLIDESEFKRTKRLEELRKHFEDGLLDESEYKQLKRGLLSQL